MIKRNKTLLLELNEIRKPNTNLVLLRSILDNEYTRIDFGYIATPYFIKGGWIRISADTYVSIQGEDKKYRLTHADNIPIAPDHFHFKSNKDWQYFSLYFEPLPIENMMIDIIEAENPDENDFNYYGIDFNVDTAAEILNISD